jgi:glycerol-3-phosphate dehydrogenase
MLKDLDRYARVNAAGHARRLGIDQSTIEHLIRIYGSRYSQVLALAEQDAALLAPVSRDHPDIMAQVVHAVIREGARTLPDVLLRRLTVGLSASRGRDGADAVAGVMAELLEWDGTRVQEEVAALDEQLALGAAPSLDPPASPHPPPVLTPS